MGDMNLHTISVWSVIEGNGMNLHVRLLIGLAAILVLLAASTPWPVCADGIVLTTPMTDVEMPDQKAIVVYDAESRHEDLILSIGLLGGPRAEQNLRQTASRTPISEEDVASAAWVVPVPSRPEVRVASPRWFTYLSELTKPEIKTEVIDVQEMVVGKEIEKGVEAVELLSREQVGAYDVSVLSANEPGALLEWLNDHGYVFPEEGGPILDTYVNEGGWYFVAARVLPGEHAYLEGDVQPLWFSFDAERPVYPMRLTSLVEQHEIDVLIYVLAEHRMQIREARFRTEFAGELRLSSWPDEDPDLKHLLTHRPYYVTKLRAVAFDPARDAEDLHLVRAASDEPYRQVIYQTRYRYVRLTATPTLAAATPTLAAATPTLAGPGSRLPPGERYGAIACGAVLALLVLLSGLGIVWYRRSRRGAGKDDTAS
jgi:hypothetical protein